MLSQPELFALDHVPRRVPAPAPGPPCDPTALAVGPPPPGWPAAPGPDAYAGLIGDIVAALAPHVARLMSSADPGSLSAPRPGCPRAKAWCGH